MYCYVYLLCMCIFPHDHVCLFLCLYTRLFYHAYDGLYISIVHFIDYCLYNILWYTCMYVLSTCMDVLCFYITFSYSRCSSFYTSFWRCIFLCLFCMKWTYIVYYTQMILVFMFSTLISNFLFILYMLFMSCLYFWYFGCTCFVCICNDVIHMTYEDISMYSLCIELSTVVLSSLLMSYLYICMFNSLF